jgi:hypothetical protein
MQITVRWGHFKPPSRGQLSLSRPCSYLGRLAEKIGWCSFHTSDGLRRKTEEWRVSPRHRRTSHGLGLFRRLARVRFLDIGGLPLFPHQRRSAALREHDVKHRRTGSARHTLFDIAFHMNGG